MQVDVKPVQSPSDLKAFIDLPRQIYRDNAQWVPQLRSQQKMRLDRSRFPVFDYAEVEFFLARRNGDIVGRIAAIKNENHIIFHEERVGFFGFFECIQDQRVAERAVYSGRRLAEKPISQRDARAQQATRPTTNAGCSLTDSSSRRQS